jgi:prepilin-type N-terminal cleavage/methylation domain-containing protein
MMSSSRITPDVTSSHTRRELLRGERGFSLLEISVVLAIAMIASGVLFMNLQPALKSIRATNAFNAVLATLRRAHDQAVSQKGTLQVSFTSPGTITVTQPTTLVCGATAVPATTWFNKLTTTLPTDMAFNATNLPTAAPDAFGTGKVAIDFDQGINSGGTTVYFCPDGSSRDATNNINNGVVYMQRTNDKYSSRAITLWGTTGRLRAWRLDTSSSGDYWRRQ